MKNDRRNGKKRTAPKQLWAAKYYLCIFFPAVRMLFANVKIMQIQLN